ncbi:MAG: cytochrome c oxidase subunit II [Minwuia sp.]|nr:cytochrome c oxidase subunit II [Minwuia sp.]
MKRFILMMMGLFAMTGQAMAEKGMAEPWQLNLQEPASPLAQSVTDFHDILLVVITLITLFVLGLLIWVMVKFNEKSNPVPTKTSHNTLIEVVWTVVPVLILVIVAIPSFQLLYQSDDVADAEMTLKVTGYQWYWGYEYPDQGGIAFEAYMKADDELLPGEPRLLTTDTAVVIPVKTNIQVLVTSADVGHSWALPANGHKTDAWPGRTNHLPLYIDEPGMYYGQCSELCGRNHGFMPIMVKAVPKEEFDAWVATQQAAMGITPPKVDVAQISGN